MTLWPVDSMAPASWQLMCPLSADSTPCQGRRMEAITVVLVWVPPTRKCTSASGAWQTARILSRAAAQYSSSP